MLSDIESTPVTLPFTIAPSTARYIKLGVNNAWFPSARQQNWLEFGHADVSHDLAMSLERTAIAQVYRDPSAQWRRRHRQDRYRNHGTGDRPVRQQ